MPLCRVLVPRDVYSDVRLVRTRHERHQWNRYAHKQRRRQTRFMRREHHRAHPWQERHPFMARFMLVLLVLIAAALYVLA